jgi:purine-binding chemotaxis protein CheW
MVVDGVTLSPEEVKPVPAFGAGLDTKYITGIGTAEQRMLILIDIERLMTSRDMELVDDAGWPASKRFSAG